MPDIYVSQTALGAGTGLSLTNTRSMAWLNTLSSWGVGAGLVGPGTTVHFVGTLTTGLNVQGSGTSGNPIIFYWEPGAKFSKGTMVDNDIWIYLDGRSYLTFDGGAGGSIELTDNGTSVANGGTKGSSHSGICAIYGANAGINNVTFKNLTIRNLYNRQSISESHFYTECFHTYGSNVIYQNLVLDGASTLLRHSYNPTATANVTITGCTFRNYNHAVEIGAGAGLNPILTGLTITHNTFLSGDMYESPDNVELGLHRNAIFLFNESAMGGFNGGVSTGYIDGLVISHNFIKHGTNPQSHTAGTGAMFFDAYNNALFRNVKVFNNVSTLAYPLSWSGGGGFIAGVGQNCLVANNTAIAWVNGSTVGNGEISAGGTNVKVANNILISSNGLTLATFANTTGLTNDNATKAAKFSTFLSTKNIFNRQGTNSFYSLIFSENSSSVWQSSLLDSLAQWKASYGGLVASLFDSNSVSTTVQLDASYRPVSGDTVATGQGENLTSLGITDDYYGTPRPSTGAWTIGAAQASSTASPAPIANAVPKISAKFACAKCGATIEATVTNAKFV